MQLHELKPKFKSHKKKRVGRGGKRGTFSGRGIKGQHSRAGRKFKPMVKEVVKRYPKLRGYRFNAKPGKPTVVNLEILEKKFQENEIISPKILLQKRIIRRMKGRLPKVKILAKGTIKKPFIFENCQFSKKAREEIEKAGGKIK